MPATPYRKAGFESLKDAGNSRNTSDHDAPSLQELHGAYYIKDWDTRPADLEEGRLRCDLFSLLHFAVSALVTRLTSWSNPGRADASLSQHLDST